MYPDFSEFIFGRLAIRYWRIFCKKRYFNIIYVWNSTSSIIKSSEITRKNSSFKNFQVLTWIFFLKCQNVTKNLFKTFLNKFFKMFSFRNSTIWQSSIATYLIDSSIICFKFLFTYMEIEKLLHVHFLRFYFFSSAKTC